VKRFLPLLLVLIALPLQAADAVYDSSGGHACFLDLLKKSGWGLAGPYERAAFIVENNDGTFGCVDWPSIHIFHSETYHGAIPPNAVAIAHTHPAQFIYPSERDGEEATRLGLPIYTITIRGVYKSLPGVQRALMIVNRQSWIRATPHLTAGLRPDRVAGNVDGNGVTNK